MVGTAAGNDADLVDLFDVLVAEAYSTHIQPAVKQYGVKRIAYSLRLFMDFLHHKMLKASLFSSLGIPFDFGKLLFDRLLVHIIEGNLAISQACHLQVTNIINLAGIF